MTVACDGATARPENSRSGSPHQAAKWRAYDKYLRGRAAAGRFSGAVLVAKGGQPLLHEAYGMADRKEGIPNTTDTKFCIASMGKMFTAVATAQLVEQGRLSFGDTIGRIVRLVQDGELSSGGALGKQLSDFPAEIADKVAIHHLLTHTSGMVKRARTREPARTAAGLMRQIVTEPLQFEPGSRFAYSNNGFIVLGGIIEVVAGQAYADYVTQHVFEPAGMTDTAIRVYRPAEVSNMAHGYMLVDEHGQPVPPRPPRPGADPTARPGRLRDNGDRPQIASPAGGAYSTTGDMLAFARALTSHRLLGPELTNTVTTGKVDATRPGGPPAEYGYGFSVQRINGVRIVGHGGGTPGYEAQLDIYPDLDHTVVIMTNQDRVLLPAMRRSEEILSR